MPTEKVNAMRADITRAIVLPSIAVLLGAYYVLFEYSASEEPQPPPPPPHLFHDLASEHITKLEIRTGDKELMAVKQEGRWMLTEPQRAPANQDEVARLISILQEAEYMRKLRLEQVGRGLEQFGLARPSLTISVWSKNPRTHKSTVQRMRFGATSPSGATVYASATGSDDLLLVDAEIISQIKYFLFVPPLERKPRAGLATP